jgi:acylphosphatase
MTDASDRKTEHVRRTIRYSGRVQGVGFRATARDVAAGFRVTGYVQNLVDGRVLMVAEGTRDEVERFCTALAVAMQRNITSTDCDDASAEPQFTDFTIKY